MATPLPSAFLNTYRPKNVSGQPSWSCQYAQVLGQSPAGTRVSVERTGVDAWSILGIDIGSAPTPQQVASALVSQHHATKVLYIETWLQDGRILGTGFVTWWYIGVYY